MRAETWLAKARCGAREPDPEGGSLHPKKGMQGASFEAVCFRPLTATPFGQ